MLDEIIRLRGHHLKVLRNIINLVKCIPFDCEGSIGSTNITKISSLDDYRKIFLGEVYSIDSINDTISICLKIINAPGLNVNLDDGEFDDIYLQCNKKEDGCLLHEDSFSLWRYNLSKNQVYLASDLVKLLDEPVNGAEENNKFKEFTKLGLMNNKHLWDRDYFFDEERGGLVKK